MVLIKLITKLKDQKTIDSKMFTVEKKLPQKENQTKVGRNMIAEFERSVQPILSMKMMTGPFWKPPIWN